MKRFIDSSSYYYYFVCTFDTKAMKSVRKMIPNTRSCRTGLWWLRTQPIVKWALTSAWPKVQWAKWNLDRFTWSHRPMPRATAITITLLEKVQLSRVFFYFLFLFFSFCCCLIFFKDVLKMMKLELCIQWNRDLYKHPRMSTFWKEVQPEWLARLSVNRSRKSVGLSTTARWTVIELVIQFKILHFPAKDLK